ncbi:MAG: glycosyltransferase family 4 protein [Gaiellaceae bacterium]
MRVLVLTTSYPRHDDDFAGRFLADSVERLQARGLEVDLLAPGRGYRDYGLAYGEGMSRNVRRRPWAVPPLLTSMTRAARRAARKADVVHAHWLPTGFPAAFSGKPFVLTLHGTDVELARHGRLVAQRIVRRASVVIGVSRALTEAARGLGARDARFVPNGMALPVEVAPEGNPAEVLYAGRLSAEKGIEDLLAVADGLQLVVAGDGPLRPQVPQALGMLPREQLYERLDRAAVVVFPSRRDGFPVACAEAMAHGRAVVATAVGGLPDMVVDGETGLLVPPGDRRALRAAIDRLLDDSELRRRLGANARARIEELCGWERVIDQTVAAYEAALDPAA